LPSPHASILDRDVARQIDHQADGEFRSGMLCAVGSAHDDTLLLCRGDIDRGIFHPAGYEQLQVRKLLDQATREGRTLAHDADDIEIA
jgi:hypothetical protein